MRAGKAHLQRVEFALRQAAWRAVTDHLGSVPNDRGEFVHLEVGPGVKRTLERRRGVLAWAVLHFCRPEEEGGGEKCLCSEIAKKYTSVGPLSKTKECTYLKINYKFDYTD